MDTAEVDVAVTEVVGEHPAVVVTESRALITGEHRRAAVEGLHLADGQERLGAAADDLRVVRGVGGDPGGVGGNFVDLHGAEGLCRDPRDIRDEPSGDRERLDLRAEGRHSFEAGGTAQHRSDDLGARSGHPSHVEVVAHDEVLHTRAGQVRRERRGPGASGQQLLDAVEQPDGADRAQGDEVADRPRVVTEGLQGLVERASPFVLAERGAREEQGPIAVAVGVEPVGRLAPVVGHILERAESGHPPGDDGEGGEAQQGQGQAGGHGAHPHRRAATVALPGPPAPRGEDCRAVREPRGDGEGHDGTELVQVAERGEWAVEEVVHRARGTAAERPGVARSHHQHRQRKGRGPERALREVPARKAPQAHGGDEGRGQDRGRQGDQRPGTLEPGATADDQVTDPIAGAPQHFDRGGGRGGDRCRLGEVGERQSVAALEYEGDTPPRGGQDDRQRPPPHQRSSPRTGCAGEQPQRRQDEHGRRGGGVHSAHRDDREA